MKHPYKPSSFWENDHSSVGDAQAQEGCGIRTIGGGDNALEAKYLYRLREAALRNAIGRSLNFAPAAEKRTLRVFEFGCGSGYWIPRLAKIFQNPIHYHGGDISQTAVQRLQSNFPDHRFFHLNGSDESWEPLLSPPPFAHVFAIDVLYHITDDAVWDSALQNLMKIVESGGFLIFSDYGYTEPRSSPSSSHVKHRPMQEYFDRFDANGFELVSIQPQFYFLNRIKYGPFRDHGAFTWSLWRLADRNRVALHMLYLLDRLIVPLLRPLDPRSKSRVFVFRKLQPVH